MIHRSLALTRNRIAAGALAVTLVVASQALLPGVATAAFQAPSLGSSESDPRAEYHDGNVTTCAQVLGVPTDAEVQIGATGWDEADDAYVTGTTDGTTKVNVDITAAGEAAGVVIDAVVVKGGDGYNVYGDPYVPPTLEPPQNYISPLNEGGNVPDISHWFVCYHVDMTPNGDNRALLAKVVLYPQRPRRCPARSSRQPGGATRA